MFLGNKNTKQPVIKKRFFSAPKSPIDIPRVTHTHLSKTNRTLTHIARSIDGRCFDENFRDNIRVLGACIYIYILYIQYHCCESRLNGSITRRGEVNRKWMRKPEPAAVKGPNEWGRGGEEFGWIIKETRAYAHSYSSQKAAKVPTSSDYDEWSAYAEGTGSERKKKERKIINKI